MLPDECLPLHLKALADELDALSGIPAMSGGAFVFPGLLGGDFQVLGEVGRGAMGIVYEARQVSLERLVALKILRPGLAQDAACRARFSAEGRLVARLHHPGIVEVYSAGVSEGVCYFAMERLPGRTARDRGYSDWREVASLGRDVARALAYAHTCGVLHRDIKPENLLVDTNGRWKLGDFGLACLAGERAVRAGTRRYMAPELHAGSPASAGSDQYALGVTLMELCALAERAGMPRDLEYVLGKATASDPARRYADVASLADDLERVLEHRPTCAHPLSWPRRVALWGRRNPLGFAAAGGLVATGLGFFAALFLAFRQSQRTLAAAEIEAARAARSLAAAFTEIDRESTDLRDDELRRGLESIEALRLRFPSNSDIREAESRIRSALELHARIKARSRVRLRPRPYRPPPARSTSDE